MKLVIFLLDYPLNNSLLGELNLKNFVHGKSPFKDA